MVKSENVCDKFERTSFDALLNYLGYSDILVLEKPIFKYPHKVNTESCGIEITINMISGPQRYEVDRIGFAWNDDVGKFDVIQASIKNSAFESLKPLDVNSAKFLGYGFVDKRYLEDFNIKFTKKLKETPGEFEHIHNTTTYEFLERFGVLSDVYHYVLIVNGKKNSGGKRSGKNHFNNILEKDLKQNGIEIYSIHDIVRGTKKYKSTTNLEGLVIPDNELKLIHSIKGVLSSKGCWTDAMVMYLEKIELY
ncbi:MAG: hypothetical protein K0B07_03185 [DPANN group archaeon]|nr:hypothetical protein [DPANN group archaeon]